MTYIWLVSWWNLIGVGPLQTELSIRGCESLSPLSSEIGLVPTEHEILVSPSFPWDIKRPHQKLWRCRAMPLGFPGSWARTQVNSSFVLCKSLILSCSVRTENRLKHYWTTQKAAPTWRVGASSTQLGKAGQREATQTCEFNASCQPC